MDILPNTAPSYEQLLEAVHHRRCILFAGAGLSMSVGLPSWSQLIEHMCAELDLEPSAAKAEYPVLAEYYRLQHGSIGALRSWMDRMWSVSEEAVRSSDIHRAIVALDFPIVYTTNYDSNLEVAYRLNNRDYIKIVNTRDLVHAREGVRQIIKFHGDFEDDLSLVLAETDYFDRLAFDTPLDIKFRADILGRSLLFIGYSMSDLNIRILLHKLSRLWRDAGREADRPPSFVFVKERERVRDAVLENWGLTILSEPDGGLAAFLNRMVEDLRQRGSIVDHD